MSAVDELLKNLMQRAGIKKSRKRARDTVYEEDKAIYHVEIQRRAKNYQAQACLLLEAKSTKLEENNC